MICPNTECPYTQERAETVEFEDGTIAYVTLPACTHSKEHMHTSYCQGVTGCPGCVEIPTQAEVDAINKTWRAKHWPVLQQNGEL